jgi:hypothetical protein
LAKSEWQKAQSRQQILQTFFWHTAKILYEFHTKMFCKMDFCHSRKKAMLYAKRPRVHY